MIFYRVEEEEEEEGNEEGRKGEVFRPERRKEKRNKSAKLRE